MDMGFGRRMPRASWAGSMTLPLLLSEIATRRWDVSSLLGLCSVTDAGLLTDSQGALSATSPMRASTTSC